VRCEAALSVGADACEWRANPGHESRGRSRDRSAELRAPDAATPDGCRTVGYCPVDNLGVAGGGVPNGRTALTHDDDALMTRDTILPSDRRVQASMYRVLSVWIGRCRSAPRSVSTTVAANGPHPRSGTGVARGAAARWRGFGIARATVDRRAGQR
jgi:hypothetical protein